MSTTDKLKNAPQLLPCPFCGDEGEKGIQAVTLMNAERTSFKRVSCRCCGATCPEPNWNHRAATLQQDAPVATDDAGIYEFWARNKEAERNAAPTPPAQQDDTALLIQCLTAMEAMMQEFRALDLPYGSKAYALAKDCRLDLIKRLATEPNAETVAAMQEARAMHRAESDDKL